MFNEAKFQDTLPIIRPDHEESISRNIASLNMLVHDLKHVLFRNKHGSQYFSDIFVKNILKLCSFLQDE